MFRHGPSCLQGPVSRTLAQGSGAKTLAADAECSRPQSRSCDPSASARPIRTELVQRVRRAIAEGRYETAEKWQAALELLFQQLQTP